MPAPTTSICDFSGTGVPVIKGNIGSSAEKIYHVPDSQYYAQTIIDEAQGERWFCTVAEAIGAGWRAPLQLTPTPTTPPTATPTGSTAHTPTPVATTATAGGPDVQIACIFFDGAVPRSESDEYVEIVNLGDAAQALESWRLVDIADGSPEFVFPLHLLGAGESVRVYTDEVHTEWGGFSFERGTAVWNNDPDDPDEAGLYNQVGELVSTKSYPPGCQ